MRKEAIKNENYLSLRQLRTIAPGFRLRCVLLRPRTPAAPLRSRQPPPGVGSVRAPLQPPLSTPTATTVHPHKALPAWEPGAGPLPAAPFSPALAPRTRKWRSSLKRPLGGPCGSGGIPALGEAILGPPLPSATTGHRPLTRSRPGVETPLLASQPPAFTGPTSQRTVRPSPSNSPQPISSQPNVKWGWGASNSRNGIMVTSRPTRDSAR